MIVCLNSLSFSKKRMSIKISARWNEAYVLSSFTMSQWLQEFPYVRYRAARSAATDSTSTTTGRDLVPTKVAAALWDRLMKYKTNLLNFPQVETCELIIVDRSIDPVCMQTIIYSFCVIQCPRRISQKGFTKMIFFS